MKRSRQILVFLLYALIIGLVVLLRSNTIIILIIAIVGGAILMWLLRGETGVEIELPAKDFDGTNSNRDNPNEIVLQKVTKSLSKERYIEIIGPYKLTKRELELGFMIVSGFTNAKIAEELYISESTVKKHASHIYEKLGVTGRKEFKEIFKP